jgi:hypothetical protein
MGFDPEKQNPNRKARKGFAKSRKEELERLTTKG